MVRVGFILPSGDHLFDPFRGDPFTHFCLLNVIEAHYGSTVEVTLIDLRGIKREFAEYHIPECDIYLYSVFTLESDEIFGIVRTLRARYPKAVHVAGGYHINLFSEDSQRSFDSIVVGEGEESIITLIDDYMRHDLQPRYEHHGAIDINRYPFWRRHYLPESAVARKGLMTLRHQKGYEDIMGTTVLFSRGCPYRCNFCSMEFITRESPGIRYRSPESVADEIAYLKSEYGIQGLNILDEIAIPLNMRDATAHLEAIGRHSIVWRGHARADGITPELAQMARNSGCISIAMGVESVVQQCLDAINKRIKIERVRDTIRILKEVGIEIRLCLILGLPGEPPDIVERTWQFIQETDPDRVFLSLLTIRAGTKLFDHPEQFGIRSLNRDKGDAMHMYGRHSDEMPTLTFEYERETPWGPSLDKDTIVQNYLTLQARLRESGYTL